jgi:hypothetical protein
MREVVVNGKLKSEKLKRDGLVCLQFRDIHFDKFVKKGTSRGLKGKG